MAYLDTTGLNTFWTKLKSTFLQDAPSDSKQYARMDGSWSEVSASSSIVISATAPMDTTKLWIDTGNGGIAKYYNGSAWTTVKSVWG